MNSNVLIRGEHLKKYFPVHESLFRKKDLKAIDDISVEIYEGETLALVGESGCGKSTLGKLLINLLEPTGGKVYFMGEELTDEVYEKHITDIQMIFQDPLTSLNPRMTVYDVIAEPLRVCHVGDEESIKERVYELVDLVGFKKNALYRYPHEFSGGQCQRIGIARALALNPKLIVCDEPVSALDVSIKAQIINKFAEIQKQTGVAYLFITHDLLTVRYVSHRIAVMYLGKILEIADTEELYKNPVHPYTKALLSAIMFADVDAERNVIPLEGEIPSPINTPSGCPFRTRCKYARPECADTVPELKDVGSNHKVACLFLEDIK